jgi:hypothetical protein
LTVFEPWGTAIELRMQAAGYMATSKIAWDDDLAGKSGLHSIFQTDDPIENPNLDEMWVMIAVA